MIAPEIGWFCQVATRRPAFARRHMGAFYPARMWGPARATLCGLAVPSVAACYTNGSLLLCPKSVIPSKCISSPSICPPPHGSLSLSLACVGQPVRRYADSLCHSVLHAVQMARSCRARSRWFFKVHLAALHLSIDTWGSFCPLACVEQSVRRRATTRIL